MKQYNSNLDIVRILAAIMVLLVHVGQKVGGRWQEVTFFGQYGVQIFFVMSGYLGMKSLECGQSVKEYYRHRIVRIVPLYYLVLCLRYLYDLIWYLVVERWTLSNVLCGPCSFRYFRYFLFLNMFVPSDDWALWNNRNNTWTMCSFAFFYLMAPWIYKLIKRFWKAVMLLAISLAITPLWIRFLQKVLEDYPNGSELNTFCGQNPISELYVFLFGVTLYYAVKENKLFLYGMFLAVLLMVTQFQWHAVEIVAGVIVLLAIALPAICLFDLEKTVRKAAKMSFALYLIHPMTLSIVEISLGRFEMPRALEFALYVGLSILVSGLIYFVVAEPVEKKVRKAILN